GRRPHRQHREPAHHREGGRPQRVMGATGGTGPVSTGAILLVGGRSRRMGGGSKPLLEVGGQTLFARAVHALTDAGCTPIIAAGPVLDEDAPVLWAREDPPF